MTHSTYTPSDDWQSIVTWQDLRDPTSETFCGVSEMWLPPSGISTASDLNNLIPDSGVCVFVVLHDQSDVSGLHHKYLCTQGQAISDAMLSLSGFKNWPDRYGIYYTP